MTSNIYSKLNSRTTLYNFLCTVKAGIYATATYPVKRALLVFALMTDLLLCIALFWPRHHIPTLYGITFCVAFLFFVLLGLLIFSTLGYIPGAMTMQQNFQRIEYAYCKYP